LRLEKLTHQSPRKRELKADGGEGSAEPLSPRRRQLSTGKNWVDAPVGLSGVDEDGMAEENGGERGKVSVPAKTVPYGKALRITATREVEGWNRDWQMRAK